VEAAMLLSRSQGGKTPNILIQDNCLVSTEAGQFIFIPAGMLSSYIVGEIPTVDHKVKPSKEWHNYVRIVRAIQERDLPSWTKQVVKSVHGTVEYYPIVEGKIYMDFQLEGGQWLPVKEGKLLFPEELEVFIGGVKCNSLLLTEEEQVVTLNTPFGYEIIGLRLHNKRVVKTFTRIE
jgi:hypothetical protein